MLLSVIINSLELIFVVVVVFIVIYFWFFRIRLLIDSYLRELYELVNYQPKRKHRLIPFYSKSEAVGLYKDREVVGGIRYLGRGLEWMPLPYIKIKLKDVIRYNYHKLPYFAQIERGWLILNIVERLPGGLLDKGYKRFFTKHYLVITLARLITVAEDVERGKTLKEIFRGVK